MNDNTTNYSVKNQILNFEKLAEETKKAKSSSTTKSSHTLTHEYQDLTIQEETSHTVKDTAKSIIDTSNNTTTTSSEVHLEDHTLSTDQQQFSPVIQEQSEKTTVITEPILHSESKESLVKTKEETVPQQKSDIQENKQDSVEGKVSDENKTKVKASLDSLKKLVSDIATDKRKKLGMVTDDETGEQRLETKRRGSFSFKAGSSENTINLMTRTLPKMLEEVLQTEDPSLMKEYQDQLVQIKNSPWGQTISKNNPLLQQSLNAMIKTLDSSIQNDFQSQMDALPETDLEILKLAKETSSDRPNEKLDTLLDGMSRNDKLETLNFLKKLVQHPGCKDAQQMEIHHAIKQVEVHANRLTEQDLTNLFLGRDSDKKLSKDIIDMAGWGVPSHIEIQQSLTSAIQILKDLKEQGKPIDAELKNLVSTALQLLEKKPPIKNLRKEDDNYNFLKNVLEPLQELTTGSDLEESGNKLKELYEKPPLVIVKDIKYESHQSSDVFLEKMKSVSRGTISPNERNALLDGMTRDLRSHCAKNLTNIQEGEFDGQGWNKTNKNKTSPSIVKSQENFNKELSTIVDLVLDNCEEPLNPTQAKLQFEFLCDLLDRLMKDNNYAAVFSLAGSLNSIALNRLLNDPRIGVDERSKEIFKNANQLVTQSRNYGNYRKTLLENNEKFSKGELKNPPIPYLGVILTDLTFISDGNKSNVDGKINGNKIKMLSKSIKTFKSMQKNLRKDADNPIRETGFIDLTSKERLDKSGNILNEDEREEVAKAKSRKLLPPA